VKQKVGILYHFSSKQMAQVVEHNKSKKVTLALLDQEDATLLVWHSLIQEKLRPVVDTVINGSPCSLLYQQNGQPVGDGRLTIERVKVAYAYQVVAWKKFGRDELKTVSPSKSEVNAKTISHLCGTPNCCNPDHLVIEAKTVNDERTHCHWCCENAVLKCSTVTHISFAALFCPHNPTCYTKRK
jgi:hypothetical protein